MRLAASWADGLRGTEQASDSGHGSSSHSDAGQTSRRQSAERQVEGFLAVGERNVARRRDRLTRECPVSSLGGFAMPSDFITLFSGDLDLSPPKSFYSKGNYSHSCVVAVVSTQVVICEKACVCLCGNNSSLGFTQL